MVERYRFVPYVVLLVGVLIAASSSIMIRFAQEYAVPSIQIAAGRLLFASLILLPLALPKALPEVRNLARRDLLFGLAAGVLLAIHFASWIASLEYTSVASSVALVSTNPIWVGIASVLLLRERLARLMIAGIALTVGGSVLIAISDSSGANAANALFGNGLALLGAISGSGYFLIGRTLRPRMTILAYIWLVYSAAAVVLVLAATVQGAISGSGLPLIGFPFPVYLLLFGLAIGPQLLGHTSFNWALRYLSATFVTISILGEPIGSALLALIFFGEQFAELQLIGFVTLLIGITVAASSERSSS
ncbi:MAG: DMT family transporter [Roseiflexaceae bacterium]